MKRGKPSKKTGDSNDKDTLPPASSTPQRIANSDRSDGSCPSEKPPADQCEQSTCHGPELEDAGQLLSAKEFQHALRVLQKEGLNGLGKVIKPLIFGIQPNIGLDIVNARDRAEEAIAFLATTAKNGDDLALRSLYEVACLAADELEKQTLEDKRSVARRNVEWPMLLSFSKAWNAAAMKNDFYPLQLAKEVRLASNINYVSTKGTPLKMLISRLLALIFGWRDVKMSEDVGNELLREVKKQGYGAEAVELARKQADRKIAQQRARQSERISGLHEQLNSRSTVDEKALDLCHTAALSLKELDATEATKGEYFVLAMSVLEALTADEYQLPQFNLRSFGGIPFRSLKEDVEIRSDLRDSIRDQMRKAFGRLVGDIKAKQE